MSPRSSLFRALSTTLVACASLLSLARAEPGDDAYEFSAGQTREVALSAGASGIGLVWNVAPDVRWDTALLGVKVRAAGAAPRVDIAVGTQRISQVLDAGAQGLRFLNLTSLRPALSAGSSVTVRGEGVSVEPGAAQLVLFDNQLPQGGRVLVLAPHPDDAEIAAFGLYASRAPQTTIVTLTSGNAGDPNYQASFGKDVEGQYLFKGTLRVIDSVTVPWQGGVPPERCFNLGYFDARLAEMRQKPDAPVAEFYRPNQDTAVYRAANLSKLLPHQSRSASWAHLVEDLVSLLRKVRPAIVLAPHPLLDSHLDHEFTTVALEEALRQYKAPVRFLLYTNHADTDRYPYGPAGSVMALPHRTGAVLNVPRVYSFSVPPGLQRRKMFALESMHDLRPPPEKPGFPAELSDYLRRGPRSEETFYAYDRASLTELVQTFLASQPAAIDPAH